MNNELMNDEMNQKMNVTEKMYLYRCSICNRGVDTQDMDAFGTMENHRAMMDEQLCSECLYSRRFFK